MILRSDVPTYIFESSRGDNSGWTAYDSYAPLARQSLDTAKPPFTGQPALGSPNSWSLKVFNPIRACLVFLSNFAAFMRCPPGCLSSWVSAGILYQQVRDYQWFRCRN